MDKPQGKRHAFKRTSTLKRERSEGVLSRSKQENVSFNRRSRKIGTQIELDISGTKRWKPLRKEAKKRGLKGSDAVNRMRPTHQDDDLF